MIFFGVDGLFYLCLCLYVGGYVLRVSVCECAVMFCVFVRVCESDAYVLRV